MADTREQILEAAWELFAERGFEDVSVRDVTSAAGVNLASVSYHFGGKDGLIQETVKRCLNPLQKYGMKLLKEAEEEFGSFEKIPMKRIMMCWLRPTLMSEECGVRFDLILRLTARYLIDVDYTVPLPSKRLMNESFALFTQAILSHCPSLTPQQIVKQLIFVEGAAIYAAGLGGAIMLQVTGEDGSDPKPDRERILDEVVACAMLGLRDASGSCFN